MSRFNSSQEFQFLHPFYLLLLTAVVVALILLYSCAVLQCMSVWLAAWQPHWSFSAYTALISINNIGLFICRIITNYVIRKICYTRWNYKRFISEWMCERTNHNRENNVQSQQHQQNNKVLSTLKLSNVVPMLAGFNNERRKNPIANHTNVIRFHSVSFWLYAASRPYCKQTSAVSQMTTLVFCSTTKKSTIKINVFPDS